MSGELLSGLTAGVLLVALHLLHRRTPAAAAPAEPAEDTALAALPSDDESALPSAAAASSSSSALTPAQRAANSRAARKRHSREKPKMVLCVRNDLGMQKGKMMAQCCHAAVGVVTELLKTEPELVEAWDESGAAKIALKVNSEEELDALEAAADELGLPNYLVVDAGHTQIPENSKTVLAIGPASAAVLDKITGKLKLM